MKDAMKTLSLTKAELAERCGVREETVHHWLRGKKRMPGRMASLVVALLKQKELQDALATGDGK